MQVFSTTDTRELDPMQKFALVTMACLMLLTFVGTNLQALLWQSSDWLVSTVLPAVVVDLTNDQRSNNAVAPVRRNSVLDAAAKAKAEHMSQNEYFAHFAPDGTTPWMFFKDAGYVYAHAGENLAIHFTDSAEVVQAWMLSPAHKKNIIDSKFTEIGVGTAKGTYDGYDTVYVVQLFGTPAVAAPAVENSNIALPATPAIAAPVERVVAVPVVLAAESVAITPLADKLGDVAVAVASTTKSSVAAPVIPVDPPLLVTSEFEDVLVIETQLATSSGLAVATLVEPAQVQPEATLASVVTRPNLVFDVIYTLLFTLTVLLLLTALLVEARRLHYLQVGYSIALLVAMGGLWFVHAALIGGAVVV